MTDKSTKNITIEVTNHVYEKLQKASDLAGLTTGEFAVQAALEKADRLIESYSAIHLTERESLWLFELIENPPLPNEKFKKAMASHQCL